jgi:hypothetical protein
MAITSTTTFDVIGNTSTITFYDPSQIDQITYASGQVTFQSASSYTLSKVDYLLYFQYLNAFYNQLFINFPLINASVNTAWPLSVFDITISNVGVKKLAYTQSSNGTQFIQINYLPLTLSAGVVARVSPVTISLQEFFQYVYMLTQYTTQVSLN